MAGDEAAAIDVLVVGDVLTDVLVAAHGPRATGTDTPARIEERLGGQGANQAAWLAAEGVTVGLGARVASADRGAYGEMLRSRGVTPFLAGDPARPTGRIVVLVDPASGERDMFSDRGAGAALEADDVEPALAATRRWVHLSGYALFGPHGAEVMALVTGRARQRGLSVSVDPASHGDLARFGVARFRKLVTGVDLLLPNRHEAELLSGVASAEGAATALLDLTAAVAVTDGAAGAVLAARDQAGALTAAATGAGDVVDTTGAGDAFTAGFLAGRLDGDGPAGCLARGVRAAGRAVGALGAQPPVSP